METINGSRLKRSCNPNVETTVPGRNQKLTTEGTGKNLFFSIYEVRFHIKIVRSCFEFLQKVFLGLMCSFSCVLWAIFWSFSLLFFVRYPAIFLITEAKMPQKLIPNHRTINSKQLLNSKLPNRKLKTPASSVVNKSYVFRVPHITCFGKCQMHLEGVTERHRGMTMPF